MTIANNLQTFINSNLLPPDHVVTIAAYEIATNNTVIKKEKEKLMSINNTIEHLLYQQNSTSNNIENYEKDNFLLTSLSAPYRNTPPEIISLIFRLSIPHSQFQMPVPQLIDWFTCLNTFTHVSRHWREIAISDTVLWKSLDLNIRPKELQLATGILQRWISNMHRDNLHLTINHSHFVTPCHRLFNLYQTLNGCNRLKKLNILVTHTYPQIHLKILAQITLPMLQSLGIEENEYRYVLETNTIINLNAPKLTSLTLNSIQPRNIPHEMNLKHITNLKMDLNTYQLSEYYNLLKKCPQLVKCNITIRYNVRNLDRVEKIILPHLTTLCIDMHKRMPNLLSRLTTPALSTLYISKNPYVDLKVASFIPFIHNTPSVLQINVTGYNVTQEQKDFDHNIKFSHPNTTTNWTDSNPAIPKLKYHRTIKCDNNTDVEYSQNASGPEEFTQTEDDSDINN